ncbi:hypothetical protein L3Q82_018538 [Scortum barcoo]|uniref:Uncharacterized protein n=1 Tax=Scortum barcoo TaxID=214431 RepID=A0ACB8VEC6_9TELE|nr:hypothetical protein L3Q82_018538 [Scortum barcoo]
MYLPCRLKPPAKSSKSAITSSSLSAISHPSYHRILLHDFLPTTEISVSSLLGAAEDLDEDGAGSWNQSLAGLWSASIPVHNPTETEVSKAYSAEGSGSGSFPFLFTQYTSSCHLQKFSDDSAVVGLITDGDDREYRGLIQDFADWCLRNNLQINAGKTKQLVVDFHAGVATLRLHQ